MTNFTIVSMQEIKNAFYLEETTCEVNGLNIIDIDIATNLILVKQSGWGDLSYNIHLKLLNMMVRTVECVNNIFSTDKNIELSVINLKIIETKTRESCFKIRNDGLAHFDHLTIIDSIFTANAFESFGSEVNLINVQLANNVFAENVISASLDSNFKISNLLMRQNDVKGNVFLITGCKFNITALELRDSTLSTNIFLVKSKSSIIIENFQITTLRELFFAGTNFCGSQF